MIPTTSTKKLENVFLDICGPFPQGGGRNRYRFIIIMLGHFSKYTKLYPINRATTRRILDIIIDRYIPEIGSPKTIVTDNGTQFKGKIWKETQLRHGVKTYKTSVYHPSSNPEERGLREVGRVLRTYCFYQQGKWSEYIPSREVFKNLAYHVTREATPYMIMHEKRTPRELTELIIFPEPTENNHDQVKFFTRIEEKTKRQRDKYKNNQHNPITYKIGEKVLLKNKQLPSTAAGIAKKQLLLYTGPYSITRDKLNNTYELLDPKNKNIKGTYNKTELKKYHENVSE